LPHKTKIPVDQAGIFAFLLAASKKIFSWARYAFFPLSALTPNVHRLRLLVNIFFHKNKNGAVDEI